MYTPAHVPNQTGITYSLSFTQFLVRPDATPRCPVEECTLYADLTAVYRAATGEAHLYR